MDFKIRTLHELRERRDTLPAQRAILGFDGFVDTIVTPVALRAGPGENFTPIATIAEFGRRIAAAAGKSTNIELYPRLEKLGGNGPIMAQALLAHGAQVAYVGALGAPTIHPVLGEFARRTRATSLCAPAATTAAEFEDGKIMLGMMRSFDEITPERIDTVMGAAAWRDALAEAQLVALVNWTMIPNMTAIFADLVERVLPTLPPRPERLFFFDLADPEKRSVDDLLLALATIGRFGRFGRVALSLNLKETQQVHAALGFPRAPETEAGLRLQAEDIRARLGLATCIVHPKESAACATRDGTWWVPGPYTARPRLTTGAGDHFNAGFAAGLLMGFTPPSCLTLGVSTSGHYVRTAQSPSLAELETFLANQE